MESTDRAGQDFWNKRWRTQKDTTFYLRPHDRRLVNHMAWDWHDCLSKSLQETLRAKGAEVLEVGCGATKWLPYFSKEYGCEVKGVDYSPEGVSAAEEILQSLNINGMIRQEDMFSPSMDWLEIADVVCSFGLVEHFDDTAAAVKATATYAKKGGLVFTAIPNFAGAMGWLQQRLERSIYDAHVPLTALELKTAHERAGLEVKDWGYLGSFNPYILEMGQRGSAVRIAWRTLQSVSNRAAGITRVITRGDASPTSAIAPYAYCVARRVI